MEEIFNLNWIKIVEREQEVYLTSLFFDAYGTNLKKETGFMLKHQLFFFDKTHIKLYWLEEEIEDAKKYFEEFTKDKDNINNILNTRSIVKQKFDNIHKIKDLKKLHEDLKYIVLFNAAIPRIIGMAFDGKKLPESVREIVNIRGGSYYKELGEGFLKNFIKVMT